jgi:hypothetical protein
MLLWFSIAPLASKLSTSLTWVGIETGCATASSGAAASAPAAHRRRKCDVGIVILGAVEN